VTERNPAAYGEMIGDDYDALYPDSVLDTDATVAALSALSDELPERSFLEFGLGTGRLALKMLDRGFSVAGIEGSSAMISQLRTKPRSEEIDVRLGDFTATDLERRFSLVGLIFNTIFGLPSREAQAACFRNAARHLLPGGCFVVEAYVLHPDQLGGEWAVWPRTVHHEQIELQLSRYDAASQLVKRVLVHLREEGTRLAHVSDLYAWPGELDLIAQANGLRLRSRHGGWLQEPFESLSRKHVSVYELPAS
jgi:SAM-dependent methyltransferase